MAKPHRLLATGAAILLLVVTSVAAGADDKPDKDGDDKSFSTFVKYLKSNYDAKGQSTFGMVTFARFLVKVVKPAGVKNFKVSMLRDLQFTNLKVDEDLGAFIRKNVHSDWQPMTQVVSLKNNQYVYVFFQLEKKDAKFLIVAVQQKDAFVVQFKFEPERLAKFIEKPEILGISLTGDDNKQNANSDPAIADPAATDATLDSPPDDDKKAKQPAANPDGKTEPKPEPKPEPKSEAKSEAKAETPAKKPPVLVRKPDSQ